MDTSRLASLEYFFICRIQFGIPHIIHHSVVEEDWGLWDNSNLISQAANKLCVSDCSEGIMGKY